MSFVMDKSKYKDGASVSAEFDLFTWSLLG